MIAAMHPLPAPPMPEGASDQARKAHATLAARAALQGITCQPEAHGRVVLADSAATALFDSVACAGEFISALEAGRGHALGAS